MEENFQIRDGRKNPDIELINFLYQKGITKLEQLSDILEPNFYAVIPLSILENKKLSAGAKLLYAEIVALSKKSGKCFATNKYLSERIGMSESSIYDSLRLLEGEQLIKIEIFQDQKGTFRNIYLTWEGVAKSNTPGTVKVTPKLDINKKKLITLLHNVGESKESPVKNIVNNFFELKGIANKESSFYVQNNIVYSRYLRPAKQLLELTDGNLDSAKIALKKVAKWADKNGLSWEIETVLKKYLELDKLPV